MKHLKRLGLSFTLISVLSVVAVGGETNTPPCTPGETSTPPCPAQSVNDEPVVPGETLTAPAQPVIDVADITEAVMWALSLF